MKTSKKFLCLLLSLILAFSSFGVLAFVTAAAADGDQIVYFEYPTDGTWGDASKVTVKSGLANVYCYVYPIYGNTSTFTVPTFEGRSTRCTAEGDNIYSFNITKYGTIDDDADYAIIFSTANDNGHQTCDITMGKDCLGDTIHIIEGTRPNNVDSSKSDNYGAWANHSAYGVKASIDSLGNVTDGVFPLHQPKAQQLSNALQGYLLKSANASYFQYDNNMVICQALDVTPEAVYQQYMSDNADILDTGSEETVTVTIDGVDVSRPAITGVTASGSVLTIPAPSYVRDVLGVSEVDEPTEEPTTVPVTTVPATTVKPTTAPVTTVKPTTVPATTVKPTTVPATTVKPTTVPATTVAPTTVPATTVAPTTVAPAVETLTVKADSNFFTPVTKTYEEPAGQTLRLKYFLSEEDYSLVNAQFVITYDTDYISFTENDNQDDDDNWTVSPMATATSGTAMVVNDRVIGRVVVNFTNINGVSFRNSNGNLVPFADLTFRMKTDGATIINVDVTKLSLAPSGSTGDPDSWVVADAYQDDFSDVADSIKENAIVRNTMTSTAVEGELQPISNSVFTIAGTANLIATGWSELINSDATMTYSGGVYKYTFKDVEPDAQGKIFQLKVLEFVDGDANNKVWHGYGEDNLNYDFDVAFKTDVTVTYNPDTQIISVTGDGVIEAQIEINSMFAAGNGEETWLNGIAWDPAAPANEMTEISDNVYQIKYEEVPEFDNWAIKFAANGDWTVNWGGIVTEEGTSFGANGSIIYTLDGDYDGDNIIVNVPFESATVTATIDLTNFNVTSKKGAVITIKVENEGYEEILGDVNGDGYVDVNDVTLVQKFLAKIVTFDSDLLAVADVNKDGGVDIIDATAIQKIIAGV